MAEEKAKFQLATVAAVEAEGLKLRLDGEEEAGEKLYKCATNVLFKVGDRVKITEDSGTYIVDFILGKPMERFPLPPGGESGQVLIKYGSPDYTVAWATWPGEAPDMSKLVDDPYEVELKNYALSPNVSSISLGSASYPWNNLYIKGDLMHKATSTNGKLGFFGSAGSVKQTVDTTASVATLIAALKKYGLV